MRPPTALLFAVILFCGCRGSSPSSAVDPFLGQQTIAPPQTGWFQNQTALADPYYSTPRQATTAPRYTPPGSGTRYAPPDGSYQYQGSVGETPQGWVSNEDAQQPASAQSASRDLAGDTIAIPAAARQPVASANASETSPPGVAPDQSLAAGTSKLVTTHTPPIPLSFGRADTEQLVTQPPVIRKIEPRPEALSGKTGAADRVTTIQSSSAPLIDITELPEPGSSNSQGARSTSGTRGRPGAAVQLASSVDLADESAVRPAVATTVAGNEPERFAPTSRYDYDPQYRWIKGRLEYSQIDRKWRLRYIPIDGETDEFGGSVILSDTSALSGYERGDFVQVHGQLGQTSSQDHGYAPEYRISRINRLGG